MAETKQDPRSKNKRFSSQSPAAYLAEYSEALATAIKAVSEEALSAALDQIAESQRAGKRIYVCGNGGSAAIADHLCCDFTKGTRVDSAPMLRTQSFASNSALFTALANDFGHEVAFSKQVEYYGEAGDILIAISSSGESPNILAAVSAAKILGMHVIGFSGFSGGALAKQAHISLHVPFANYGVVEDAHQAIMHALSQFLTMQLERKNSGQATWR